MPIHRRFPVALTLTLALVLAGLAAGACAYVPAPIPVTGDSADLQALAGEWAGAYVYDAPGHRTGSILFRLAADSDTARGDVLMIFPGPQPGSIALPGAGEPWVARAPDQKVLSISFVRAAVGSVTGVLDPYTDPSCGCELRTTFQGRQVGARVEGTFSARRTDTGEVRHGRWSVDRRGTATEPPPAARPDLALNLDQARATLDLLAQRATGHTVPDTAWTAIFATEGHRRVMERERGMDAHFGLDRGINEASFRAWAESDLALDSLAERRMALDAWVRVDLDAAAALALAYLPAEARLRGTIYPLVREQRNSFIWDTDTDHPAIFMAVQPGLGPAALQHILAHEFHHIGAVSACAGRQRLDGPAEAREVLRWLGGFGEGLAVLAAAGGVGRPTHPHDPPDVREAWAVRLDSLATDMAALDAFFRAILAGEVTGEEAGRRGFEFINRPGAPQGAFYSVGWHMAVTVERAFGRAAVIEAVCEPARLLLRYEEAVDSGAWSSLPSWSPALMQQLRALTDPQ
jgi:hypothetical protein